ncbi:hypothetical protein QE152_g13705 [Popillia japonica]|uniref:Uncharacterized protein n=1 Tax=Popillia japonica TaxID=7064 RepID=A0AAW1L8S7_POPJA
MCQTAEIAVQEFSVSGIYLFSLHVFADADYLPASNKAVEELEERTAALPISIIEPLSTSIANDGDTSLHDEQPGLLSSSNRSEQSGTTRVTPFDIDDSRSTIIPGSAYKKGSHEAEHTKAKKQEEKESRVKVKTKEKLKLREKM